MMAVGAVYFLDNHPRRLDATSERLSTLSPHTDEVIDGLRKAYQTAEVKRPVRIEAFVSTTVPETYLQTRLNLLTTLRELKARAGDMMEVQINDTEPTGAMADLAKQRYGIAPERVPNFVHGSYKPDQIFLSVAVTCGLERVVLPFIDRGTPVEYELVRAICTVEKQKRKRIGIVETDVPVFGRFSMQGQSPPWQLIDGPEAAIRRRPGQSVAADSAPQAGHQAGREGRRLRRARGGAAVGDGAAGVREPDRGNPRRPAHGAVRRTLPVLRADVPGTSQPRAPGGPHAGHDDAAAETCKRAISSRCGRCWASPSAAAKAATSSSSFPGDEEGMMGGADQVVFQNYNPYPKRADFPPEFVFVDHACGGKGFDPFSEKDPSAPAAAPPLPRAGHIENRNSSNCGTASSSRWCARARRAGSSASQMITRTMLGMSEINPNRPHKLGPNTEYILAAHITGRLPAAAPRPTPRRTPRPSRKSCPTRTSTSCWWPTSTCSPTTSSISASRARFRAWA